MTCTDIFIKTYHKDFMWLSYCLRSIKKFASGFRDVVVVSDNDGHKIPQEILDIMPVKLIYHNVPTKWPPKMRQPPGYVWQQVVKLNWTEFTDADSILILDSDLMFTDYVTPELFKDKDGKWFWNYRSWELADQAICWKTPTEELLGFEPQYEGMLCVPFVFERTETLKFIEYIKSRHGANDVFDVLFKYNMMLISEFNAYGAFILKFDSTAYCPLINQARPPLVRITWSYGGLSEKEIQEREIILNK